MYQKNIKEQIAPASITKLMTAILLLDSYSIDDTVNLQIDDPNIKGKIAYFKPNVTMSIEDLIDFLLVYSANDAAHAAALLVADTEQEFIAMMNDRANKLNMKNTNFTNVHGLDEQGHYTTIEDLLALSLECLKYPEIIVSTSKEYFYHNNDEGNSIKYYSTNTLLDDNFTGLKTGWTDDAGLTFVGLYQGLDRNIISIVNRSIVDESLNSHFRDTIKLIELSIFNFNDYVLIENGEPIFSTHSATTSNIIKNNKDVITFGYINNPTKIFIKEFNGNTLSLSLSNEIILNYNTSTTSHVSLISNLLTWLFRF